jgi:hypothetical protein
MCKERHAQWIRSLVLFAIPGNKSLQSIPLIYLPIAELCNNNYLHKQQQIPTQAIKLTQSTLVSSHLFIYHINKSRTGGLQANCPNSNTPINNGLICDRERLLGTSEQGIGMGN